MDQKCETYFSALEQKLSYQAFSIFTKMINCFSEYIASNEKPSCTFSFLETPFLPPPTSSVNLNLKLFLSEWVCQSIGLKINLHNVKQFMMSLRVTVVQDMADLVTVLCHVMKAFRIRTVKIALSERSFASIDPLLNIVLQYRP